MHASWQRTPAPIALALYLLLRPLPRRRKPAAIGRPVAAEPARHGKRLAPPVASRWPGTAAYARPLGSTLPAPALDAVWQGRFARAALARFAAATPAAEALAGEPSRLCPSATAALVHDHTREDVGLQHHQATNQAGQDDGMPKHEAQDRPLVTEPVCGRRGDHNRLRINHLAHHTA